MEHSAARPNSKLAAFTRALDEPLPLRSRLIVLLAPLLLIPTFFLPLWRMSFFSNQFPDGLRLNIYTHRLEGGKSAGRDDLREINTGSLVSLCC